MTDARAELARDGARVGARVGAIVLARAGSRGVPGKNVAPVAGRACIEWTLDAALVAELVSAVVVSTDDAGAARLARARGVSVVERPPELAGDTATVDDAARHAAESDDELRSCRAFVLLYANVPVRPAGLVDRAVGRLLETGCDSVQSYAPVGKHHPWWTARVDEGSGTVEPWEGDVLNHGVYRRQALPAAHVPDGGVLVVTRDALFGRIGGVRPGAHAFFGRDRRGVVTEEGAVVDIDAPIDLVVADALLRRRHARREERACADR